MLLEKIMENSFYLLAVINPMSKICILSVLSGQEEREALRKVILKSSLAAMMMLFCVMAGGAFVLSSVLKVQLYSLRASGGGGAVLDRLQGVCRVGCSSRRATKRSSPPCRWCRWPLP